MYRSGKVVWPFYCCDPGWSVLSMYRKIYSHANSIRVLMMMMMMGQLKQGKCFFPCPRSRLRIWSREAGSAVSSVPRQPAHLSHTQAEYGAYLQDSSRVSAAASIYLLLFKPPYAIGSLPGLSGHAIAYRWRSLPRVHRHRAGKPVNLMVVPNGCCLGRSAWTN